jgi:hypothetical protein
VPDAVSPLDKEAYVAAEAPTSRSVRGYRDSPPGDDRQTPPTAVVHRNFNTRYGHLSRVDVQQRNAVRIQRSIADVRATLL